jgi:hypothetical protein
VKFAEIAQSHANSWATPRVRAVFALREARGLANLKAGAACQATLTTSTSYFDAGPQDGDLNWIGYLNEEFATLAGVCLMDLGRATEAGNLRRRHRADAPTRQEPDEAAGSARWRRRRVPRARARRRHRRRREPEPPSASSVAANTWQAGPE